jgi:hypothetical protein
MDVDGKVCLLGAIAVTYGWGDDLRPPRGSGEDHDSQENPHRLWGETIDQCYEFLKNLPEVRALAERLVEEMREDRLGIKYSQADLESDPVGIVWDANDKMDEQQTIDLLDSQAGILEAQVIEHGRVV